jgi:hypothetical protein
MYITKNVDRGRALRTAFGITALILVIVGGAGAEKSINDNTTGCDWILPG